ncbi:MAG: gluconate 2-dehydrogenase subunit 3 family protein [Paraglaciecola sp.]|uniref:gluconate 2-dehydrogenase subunit 3 family protein n=1 Tax=Paraglaciecola sp. TaxID=1920173 RepID=UPI0032998B14
MLSKIADIIIPDTDTPGARKAGVPEYIEHMLFNLLSKQDSEKWLFEFNTFNKKVGGFNHLSARMQLNAVTRLDDNLGSDDFYKKLKELTVIGYYTSEIGASIELQYDPVPGPYQEMPLAVIGRAWS